MTLSSFPVVSFFIENAPSFRALLIGGPPGLIWAWICLYGAGWLKREKGWQTGHTRKVFHFLIFGAAALVQFQWGTPGVCLFGAMVSLVILYALIRGDGHLLYEAMAREKDEPHRTRYIVVPYFATLAGGLAANILFSHAAVTGYLVTGLGDAVGEPVGTAFGKHPYRVPTLTAVEAVRSVEGSTAVFAMSLLAVPLGAALSPTLQLTPGAWAVVPLIALLSTVLEAVSPHGWDNAVLQIVPSFLADLWL
jgi:phytol kinase